MSWSDHPFPGAGVDHAGPPGPAPPFEGFPFAFRPGNGRHHHGRHGRHHAFHHAAPPPPGEGPAPAPPSGEVVLVDTTEDTNMTRDAHADKVKDSNVNDNDNNDDNARFWGRRGRHGHGHHGRHGRHADWAAHGAMPWGGPWAAAAAGEFPPPPHGPHGFGHHGHHGHHGHGPGDFGAFGPFAFGPGPHGHNFHGHGRHGPHADFHAHGGPGGRHGRHGHRGGWDWDDAATATGPDAQADEAYAKVGEETTSSSSTLSLTSASSTESEAEDVAMDEKNDAPSTAREAGPAGPAGPGFFGRRGGRRHHHYHGPPPPAVYENWDEMRTARRAACAARRAAHAERAGESAEGAATDGEDTGRRGRHGRHGRHGHGFHGQGFHGQGFGHGHGHGHGHDLWSRGEFFGAGFGPGGPHGPHFDHRFGGPPPCGGAGFGARGFGFGGGPHHHGHHGRHGRHGLMGAFANHPMARRWSAYFARAGANRDAASPAAASTFSPPIDVFVDDARGGWILHVALPGARKEDVDVKWDADRSELSISGVVVRPGDEALLEGLINAERRVGVFHRYVRLPPLGQDEDVLFRDEDGDKEKEAEAEKEAEKEKDKARQEVDADNITARMENGVLVVAVPTVEKEWTEVRQVDIE